MAMSQEKKPKIALVLSGGGAKGIAHIPVLQALDSLGIVPDMIIGTSMGSIVGGLYSMGYSGDSIAKLSKSIKWSELLGGKLSLEKVAVEEKSEFRKYLIDFNLRNGKPKAGAYLLNDNNLRKELSRLTLPAYNIINFDELSIPFRAVTADIANGKMEVIKEGSLMIAMRSSMSIPGVFEPVEHKNGLLIDGGVLNNFPTDIAKSMGADIIIGSDVSGARKPIDQLNNVGTIFFQTIMMANHKIYPENRKLCDILIDHIPNLKYSTADFAKSNEIYEAGKVATYKNYEQLGKLVNNINRFSQREHKLPESIEEIVLDTIVYQGISTSNLPLVKYRMNIEPNTTYSFDELFEGVERAMGTELFNKITTSPWIDGDNTGILFKGYEKPKHYLKASIHYDDYRGVGLIANYSGRNIIGQASRLLVSLDIAEQPKFLAQYQKNFGFKRLFWLRSQILGQRLRQNLFVEGEVADNVKEESIDFTNEINLNINSLKSYLGFGLNYNRTDVNPSISPDLNDNILSLNDYLYNGIEVDFHFSSNSLDKVFYPTQGSKSHFKIGRSLYQKVDATFFNVDGTTNSRGSLNDYTKLQMSYEKRFRFNAGSIVGIFRASAGITFEDELKANDLGFFDLGYPKLYFFGGNLQTQNINDNNFRGLHQDELSASQYVLLNLGFQLEPAKNIFVSPHVNAASVGFRDFKDFTGNVLSPSGDWQDSIDTSFLFSAGTTLSYRSILGPVDFDVSWVNGIDKVRMSINIGIPFNR